jgi:hypothetical protein
MIRPRMMQIFTDFFYFVCENPLNLNSITGLSVVCLVCDYAIKDNFEFRLDLSMDRAIK